jgi:hypothetical protein
MKLLCIYLIVLLSLLTPRLLAQGNSKSESLKEFIHQKDSLIAYFLKDKIDTSDYRCAFQESSGIYIFISKQKCFIHLKSANNIDSLTDRSIFRMPFMKNVGKRIIDSLTNSPVTDEYSALGSVYYFETVNASCSISFYSAFSRLNRNLKTTEFGNRLFDLFGFAKVKLGQVQ